MTFLTNSLSLVLVHGITEAAQCESGANLVRDFFSGRFSSARVKEFDFFHKTSGQLEKHGDLRYAAEVLLQNLLQTTTEDKVRLVFTWTPVTNLDTGIHAYYFSRSRLGWLSHQAGMMSTTDKTYLTAPGTFNGDRGVVLPNDCFEYCCDSMGTHRLWK